MHIFVERIGKILIFASELRGYPLPVFLLYRRRREPALFRLVNWNPIQPYGCRSLTYNPLPRITKSLCYDNHILWLRPWCAPV